MSIKALLQTAISSGQIDTKQKLLERAIALGLAVTRNGRNYVGLLAPDGKRFRIRFEFADDVQLPSPERGRASTSAFAIRSCGYWIYSLTAYSGDDSRKACYIGQAVNLRRRFREHLNRRYPNRASFELFEWAAREQVEVRATVLFWADCNQSQASYFEGYWLRLAVEAGFETPGAYRWGRLPYLDDSTGLPNRWPTTEVFAVSRSLSELVQGGVLPGSLFTTNADI